MSDVMKTAIIQRDNETYALVTHTPMGMLTAEELEKITKVVTKYQIPIVKITAAQRFALVGIKKEDLEGVAADLGTKLGYAVGLCYHYTQACPGNSVCRFGVNDSLGLGAELDKLFYEVEFPAKVKMGVSGCPLCCAESFVRDLGFFAKRDRGWTVIFGGNSGTRARVGDVIGEDLSKEEALALAERAMNYYKANAKNRERTARFMERVGLEEFKKNVL